MFENLKLNGDHSTVKEVEGGDYFDWIFRGIYDHLQLKALLRSVVAVPKSLFVTCRKG